MNLHATRLLLIRHAHIDTGKDRPRMCGWLDLLTGTEVIWRGDAPLQLLSFNVPDWWRGSFLDYKAAGPWRFRLC